MRACPGCNDPACGDDDKRILYRGVECLTCKKARSGEAMLINRENWQMSEQDELSKRAEALMQLCDKASMGVVDALMPLFEDAMKVAALEERERLLNLAWTLIENDLLRGAESEHGRGWDAGRKALLFELKQKLGVE